MQDFPFQGQNVRFIAKTKGADNLEMNSQHREARNKKEFEKKE
jgi:hypothetical protein